MIPKPVYFNGSCIWWYARPALCRSCHFRLSLFLKSLFGLENDTISECVSVYFMMTSRLFYIYNYAVVKVRLFCWWCCVFCIVLLTLCIFVLFIRARHGHNKIAPCGMINVFLIWIELIYSDLGTRHPVRWTTISRTLHWGEQRCHTLCSEVGSQVTNFAFSLTAISRKLHWGRQQCHALCIEVNNDVMHFALRWTAILHTLQ